MAYCLRQSYTRLHRNIVESQFLTKHQHYLILRSIACALFVLLVIRARNEVYQLCTEQHSARATYLWFLCFVVPVWLFIQQLSVETIWRRAKINWNDTFWNQSNNGVYPLSLSPPPPHHSEQAQIGKRTRQFFDRNWNLRTWKKNEE